MAHILVIEDNVDNLDLMIYLLVAFGHRTEACVNGQAGLAAVRDHPPDLVLCDIQLPVLNGYEFMAALRAEQCLAAIPIVAVTALAMRGEKEKVLAAGFNGYIEKPIVPESFVALVETFLPPSMRLLGEKSAPPSASRSESQTAAAQDQGLILVVDDREEQLQLSRAILEYGHYEILTVSSGEAAHAVLRERQVDLILCDVHMPGMDGLSLCRWVKNDAALQSIPYILISSSTYGDRSSKAAQKLGVSKFLTRPIDPDRLLAEIAALLRKPAGV